MKKVSKLHELVSKIAPKEGKKIQIDGGNLAEVLKCIAEVAADTQELASDGVILTGENEVERWLHEEIDQLLRKRGAIR